MEEEITYEEAFKAKEILTKYLEQELCLRCHDFEDQNRWHESMLYIALKIDDSI